jgi:hypothetical protein
VALAQDAELTSAILEYRAARSALELINSPDKTRAFRLLSENEGVLRLLARMHRAQSGLPLDGGTAAEGMSVALDARDPDADEDTDEG